MFKAMGATNIETVSWRGVDSKTLRISERCLSVRWKPPLKCLCRAF